MLVNNAGVGYEFAPGTKPSQLKMETLRATYDTNFFGVFAVTQHMLPLLRKSASPRIINQSLMLGLLSTRATRNHPCTVSTCWPTTRPSPHSTASRWRSPRNSPGSGCPSTPVCPGWVKTDLGTDAAPRTVEQGAAIAVRLATMDDPPTGKFLNDGGEIRW